MSHYEEERAAIMSVKSAGATGASTDMLGRPMPQSGPSAGPRSEDNIDRLHHAIQRIERILDAQQSLIELLTGEGTPEACDAEKEGRTPPLCEIINGAPDFINERIDRALSNVDAIRRIIYGE